MFLVINTKIFSDEMICCQGLAQNNQGHGEVGGGTDELRMSHWLETAGSWVMGKWAFSYTS